MAPLEIFKSLTTKL